MKSPCECGIEPPGSISHGVRIFIIIFIRKNRITEIRSVMEMEDNVTEGIEKRHLKWFGYMCEMDDTSIKKNNNCV